MMTTRAHSSAAAAAVLVLAPIGLAAPAEAYMGPGGTLSGLGTLLALVGAVFVAVAGFLWYPIKRLVKKRRAGQSADASADEASGANPDDT